MSLVTQLLARYIYEVKGNKSKMYYLDLIKIKSFTAKEIVNKTKTRPTEREKIFANDLSDKGLISEIYKENIKLNTPRNKKSKEMGRIYEQKFPQIRPTHGQQANEEILPIPCHQGNTDQNHNEISLYTSENG